MAVVFERPKSLTKAEKEYIVQALLSGNIEMVKTKANDNEEAYVMMRKFGLTYPEAFDELPALEEFQNRYYGYAAMFPVVLIEAPNDFGMDSADLIKLRHLWCFLTFFTSTCLFSVLIQNRFRNQYLTGSALLMLILQPRLFGDIFYNDRDLLLISWMLIFLFCLDRLLTTNRWYWILLSGISLALAINTRIFGVVLIVFPALFFRRLRTPGGKDILLRNYNCFRS